VKISVQGGTVQLMHEEEEEEEEEEYYSKVEEAAEGPAWLKPMLKANFFLNCPVHGMLNRSECNLFCLNCMGNGICSACAHANHKDHHVVQVQKTSDMWRGLLEMRVCRTGMKLIARVSEV